MTAPPVTRHPVSEKDQYLQAIATLAGQRDAAEPVWLARLRNVAADRFRRLRFPTIHDEEWKYTSVAPILRGSFTSPPGGAPATVSNDDVGKTIVDTDGPRLVFVDGRYVAELSRPVTGSAEMVATLPHGVDADPDTIEAHLGRLATTADNIFSALNTALLSDCGVIVVPRGVVLDEPIQLVFVSALDHAAIAPRMLVVLGAASAATIVETYVSLGSPEAFTNAVAEIVVGEGATLSHFRVVDEAEGTVHIGRTEVRQGSDGAYESLTVFASAALGRHDLAVHLDGPGATCTLNGLTLARGSQHLDSHTLIEHAAPHGVSRQLYKGILADHARVVFNGKIVVRPGADGTDARQANQSILLSREATVDTKPQLEIFADDVRCTHGATVGQLDPEMIFYLESRGIGEDAARTLLTYGFASELIRDIAHAEIRRYLARLVTRRVRSGEADALPETLDFVFQV